MGTVDLRRACAAFLTLAALGTVLAGCSDTPDADGGPDTPSYDAAASTPKVDSIYRGVGNAAVDVRHYDLDLTWAPSTRTLTGVETITLRGTKRAEEFSLDFDRALRVDSVDVDGAPADTKRDRNRLVVPGHVGPDRDTVVRLEYSGLPGGEPAPSQRGTLDVLGWNVGIGGEVTTIQQPWGAFTWYAVNDTPSDKAFHDVTLRVPEKWVGISNGTLEKRAVEDGMTVTRWHGSAPAAPSAMTVAIGDYDSAEAETASGTPVLTWSHDGDAISPEALQEVPRLIDWLEERLGPYPFDAVGAVVIPGGAGSDTQETITVGTTADSRQPVQLVNQLAHQWWGNAVTPADWSDLWIAEGIPFLLADGDWRAQEMDVSQADVVADWRRGDALYRQASGAPTKFARDDFGPGSVEYGSALMWQGIRRHVGDETFAQLLTGLPEEFAGQSITREQVAAWLQEATGKDLRRYLGRWLDGAVTPAG